MTAKQPKQEPKQEPAVVQGSQALPEPTAPHVYVKRGVGPTGPPKIEKRD
jgi:hypothetical protein